MLEQLAKRGQPTRAEITDAAMSDRAECVMLNKGPFIDDAVTSSTTSCTRMRRHQYKKIPLLHPLTSWRLDTASPPTTPWKVPPARMGFRKTPPHGSRKEHLSARGQLSFMTA